MLIPSMYYFFLQYVFIKIKNEGKNVNMIILSDASISLGKFVNRFKLLNVH
jgi:hypothetical protein